MDEAKREMRAEQQLMMHNEQPNGLGSQYADTYGVLRVGMMDVSNNGLAFIAAREGCVLTAHADKHHPAIGFGINDDSLKIGETTISYEEAIRRFVEHRRVYVAGVNRVFAGIDLKQHHFDAIHSATWNVGQGSGIGDEADLIAAVRAFSTDQGNPIKRDWAGYYIVRVNFDPVNGPFNLSRRCREAVLFTTGDYGDIATLKLWRAGKNPRIDPFESVPMPRFLT